MTARWEYRIGVGVLVTLSLLVTQVLHADPLRPVLPTFHVVSGELMQRGDPCPSDTPISRDGWCVSEVWLKQQHDMAPATQADIDRLQQQIDEIRRR